MSNKKLYIFDNEGETPDRYTIVLPNGSIFSAEASRFSGFGKYWGSILDKRQDDVPSYLEKLRTDKRLLGIPMPFDELPTKLQDFLSKYVR